MKRMALILVWAVWVGCSPTAVSTPNATPASRQTAVIAPPTPTSAPQPPSAYVLFSINVQDFSYPAESAAVLDKLITLHEETNMPVDIYLTDTMAQIYANQYPNLLMRLKSSPIAAISYHTRPPRPYASQNDWLGLKEMPLDQLNETILRYETHAVDPITGQTTDVPGGYQQVAALIGYSPYAASALSGNPDISAAALQVFSDLGAQMTVSHGKSLTLGEMKGNLPVRPEQVDYKLFEHVGEDAGPAFEAALAQALAAQPGDTPAFVGVKMHDNDFFATQSAWVTVYVQGGKRPDWDISLQAPPLSQVEQEAQWALYEQTVRYAASQRERVTPVNLPLVLEMLRGK
ncbi:MAG: hypothetical protein ACE5G8_16530 [Anaerolineae bacterium]